VALLLAAARRLPEGVEEVKKSVRTSGAVSAYCLITHTHLVLIGL
jgi:hypothetical protein